MRTMAPAISLARLGGLKTGLITKRISDTVALRARDLRLDHVHQGIADKLTVFREILRQEKLSAEQAAYMGDDIIDLPVMQHCGLAIAVPNSRAGGAAGRAFRHRTSRRTRRRARRGGIHPQGAGKAAAGD